MSGKKSLVFATVVKKEISLDKVLAPQGIVAGVEKRALFYKPICRILELQKIMR